MNAGELREMMTVLAQKAPELRVAGVLEVDMDEGKVRVVLAPEFPGPPQEPEGEETEGKKRGLKNLVGRLTSNAYGKRESDE